MSGGAGAHIDDQIAVRAFDVHPAPSAAATGSSIRQIFRTPEVLMALTTALFPPR